VTCRVWGDLRAFRDYAARLRKLVQNPRTLLMGPFPPESIHEVLSTHDVLVIPSLWWENSPLTIHEAALAGVPVLASDIGGMAEYVLPGVTGQLFKVGDAADLRRHLLAFLGEEDPLPGFDPRALPIKTIEQDARDMVQRYRALLAKLRPAGTTV
jgi:glycosyltransferase involved in cell wall biosynthesis